MADVESEFVRHLPCTVCGSSDANNLYSDGHTFCFSCNTHSHSDEDFTPVSTTHAELRGSAVSLTGRGISVQTCERYKIYKDGEQLRFHYFGSNGRVIGAKTKPRTKPFVMTEPATDDSSDKTSSLTTGTNSLFAKANPTQRVARKRSNVANRQLA